MTARPILSREVLTRMTDHVVTVYLADGNHLTGRLSSVIVSGHRDDRDAAQGLHLVDLADGTPHDVAYVYLAHVVAIAPARPTTSAIGDEPARPARSRRWVVLSAGAGSEDTYPLDADVRIEFDRPNRAFRVSWSSNGTPAHVEVDTLDRTPPRVAP